MKIFQIWFVDTDGEKQFARISARNKEHAMLIVEEEHSLHHFETVYEE